ncbi:MAG TPA: hypothetical protein VFN99_08665 [Gaiella sp.]|nr:hypothetical protein [Gaiella sp.]
MTEKPAQPMIRAMAEYALVTALVATLAASISAIPEGQLAARLPTTAAKARALITQTARQHRVPVSGGRTALARAPYRRAPLRYLFAAGWVDGRRSPASCVFAKATPSSTERRITTSIRQDRALVARLARMNVSVPQAAEAMLRGTASAC